MYFLMRYNKQKMCIYSFVSITNKTCFQEKYLANS